MVYENVLINGRRISLSHEDYDRDFPMRVAVEGDQPTVTFCRTLQDGYAKFYELCLDATGVEIVHLKTDLPSGMGQIKSMVSQDVLP